MQTQIHELALTLPPPRRQNVACDACRYVLCIVVKMYTKISEIMVAIGLGKSSAISYLVKTRFV